MMMASLQNSNGEHIHGKQRANEPKQFFPMNGGFHILYHQIIRGVQGLIISFKIINDLKCQIQNHMIKVSMSCTTLLEGVQASIILFK
jgi:hypothetical protein